MKSSELYSEYIANWLSEGLLITRDKISLLGMKYLSLMNFYFTDFCTIDLSECKTNRYYSITCDKNGNLLVSEI